MSSPSYLTYLGLGYSIAIALCFLVLLSTILLASYICCRSSYAAASSPHHSSAVDGVVLPRILFVAEDGDDDQEISVVVGIAQSVINSYPKFPFKSDPEAAAGDNICSICLSEFRDSEMLRMMPECKHYFHISCIDAWLRLNGSCPVCRNSPMPTPLSTPLSEVVPLSQYAADRRRM